MISEAGLVLVSPGTRVPGEPRRRHRVVILVPPSFSLFAVGAPLEMFSYPAPGLEESWYDVAVCSPRPGELSDSSGLFSASVRAGVEFMTGADTIVVPQWPYTQAGACSAATEALRRAHAGGARIISWSSGTAAVAEAGLLDGRVAAVQLSEAEEFAERFPGVRVDSQVLYEDDGSIITGAGAGSGLDVILHVLRKDFGSSVAQYAVRQLVVATHRDGGQDQGVRSPLQDDVQERDGIAVAMNFALRNLDRDLRLNDLARAASMSPRHFSRRFREVVGTSPAKWVTKQKLGRAQVLLERTDHSVDFVATACGFASVVTFRQRFVHQEGLSPTAYRRSFRESRMQSRAR